MTTAEYVEAIYSLLAKGNILQKDNTKSNVAVAEVIAGDEDNPGITSVLEIIKSSLSNDTVEVEGQTKKSIYKAAIEINETMLNESIGTSPNERKSMYKLLKDIATSTYNDGNNFVSGYTTIGGILYNLRSVCNTMSGRVNTTNTNLTNINANLSTSAGSIAEHAENAAEYLDLLIDTSTSSRYYNIKNLYDKLVDINNNISYYGDLIHQDLVALRPT